MYLPGFDTQAFKFCEKNHPGITIDVKKNCGTFHDLAIVHAKILKRNLKKKRGTMWSQRQRHVLKNETFYTHEKKDE